MNREEINLLASEMKTSSIWDAGKCEKLCAAAGLSKEWNDADGDTFENVVYKAADILGVEI